MREAAEQVLEEPDLFRSLGGLPGGLEKQGLFYEEYVTDPLTTPEDKLVVNVYVMVK